MLRSILIVAVSCIGLFLAGCTSAIEMASEDRAATNIETDSKIIIGLKNDYNNQMGTSKVFSITNDVYEQTVLLTGIVETSDKRSQAANIANAHPGVKKVINELQVIPEADQLSAGDEGYTDDIVVNTKFYGKLISTAGVSHTNWRYNSVNGVMYLFGRALNQAEMSKVVQIAKTTQDVRKVVNHAFVRAQ